MKLGIVGLPNVGKSTLFNSLTKAGALSANYPFATIDPNVGIVSVPDERIVKLGELYHTKKVTPATIEFVDIAGLVKGASKGEGLGNQFLANIREVDAIVHVVRCFEDTNIIHVDGSIDPARDIETINLELIFSDIEILDRRIAKIAKQARMDKTLAKELELVEAVKAHLEDGKMARSFEVPDDEDAQIWFKGYNLLTAKPTIYAANVAEDDLADDGASNPHVAKVREMAAEEGAKVFVICAQIEQELAELSEEEKKEYLVYNEALDKTAVTVDDVSLTLKDIAFYVAYEEKTVQEQAILYNPDNPRQYWNVYTDGQFVKLTAKQAALDMAVHDEIFYQMAVAEGVKLDVTEQEYLENDESDFWSDLEDWQREQLGISEEELDSEMEKIALADKYQSIYAEMNQKEYEAYNFNGEAYEALLSEHKYSVNEKVWDRVDFGSVTLDN